MILVRSPLRISIAGGGTDVPSFFEHEESLVLAAAINKYVYVSVLRPFTQGIFLKYSEIERTNDIDSIRHPIIREVLRLLNPKNAQIEITALADIPAGTGLGSSGSFTTALIKALYVHYRKRIDTRDLAELACDIEINKLSEPIGKQDQYISAFGGLAEMHFHKNGIVNIFPLPIKTSVITELEERLMLFYTGTTRTASSILEDQVIKSRERNQNMLQNLQTIKRLAIETREALQKGDTSAYGGLMNEHWQVKRGRSKGISNDAIDELYQKALRNGAVGGKLVGAGGGGFFLFYTESRDKLRMFMAKQGLEEMRFTFDFEGTKVVFS